MVISTIIIIERREKIRRQEKNKLQLKKKAAEIVIVNPSLIPNSVRKNMVSSLTALRHSKNNIQHSCE